jgi:hypothetical protein
VLRSKKLNTPRSAFRAGYTKVFGHEQLSSLHRLVRYTALKF